MGQAVKVIAGIALLFVGGTWNAAAWRIGWGLILSAAAEALAPKHRLPGSAGVQIEYGGQVEPRVIVYGTMRVAGLNVIPAVVSGDQNKYLHQVLALAGHWCDEITDVYFDKTTISSANIGSVTGADSDGAVSGGFYAGKAWIRRYNGTPYQTADYILQSATWGSSAYRGAGVAYLAIRYEFDSEIFKQGKPEVSARVAGKRVYDPREDTRVTVVPSWVTASASAVALTSTRYRITSNGAGGAWGTAAAYANNGSTTAWIRAYPASGVGGFMVALDENPTAGGGFLDLAFAFYCETDGTLQIFENGSLVCYAGRWDRNTRLEIVSNGVTVYYLKDHQLLRGAASGSATLYPDSTFFSDSSCYFDVEVGNTGANIVVHRHNPALQLADYLIDTALGMGEHYDRIDWALVEAAADICDQLVSIPGPTTQARYTSSVAIECTQPYEETLEILANAMLGYVHYSSGKWRMYAGAWSTPSFALTEDDLTGPVEMQTETPRKEKYNYVRGWFLDASREYQQGEFEPQSDADYEAEDGERIPREVQFPCCTNNYEAQRNARLLLRRSRNRRVVTITCGMSAFKVRPWATGTLTLEEFGWNEESVRCIGWQFTPDGQVRLTLREETEAQWADPGTSDYTVPNGWSTGTPGAYEPGPVRNLTSQGITDALVLRWDLPVNYIGGVVFDVYEYTASSPFGSATKIRETAQTSITIGKTDTTTRYYWVVARHGTTVSNEEPIGNGIAAAAATVTTVLRAHAAPTSTGDVTTAAGATSGTVAVTAAGGTPPYTYAWTRIIGDASTTVGSPSSASTNFSRSGMSVGATYSSVWRCTISDSGPDPDVTVDVSVSFTRIDTA